MNQTSVTDFVKDQWNKFQIIKSFKEPLGVHLDWLGLTESAFEKIMVGFYYTRSDFETFICKRTDNLLNEKPLK